MYRIRTGADCPIVDVETAGQIEAALRAVKPGRYRIDEITHDPLHFGRTSRRWGVGIKRDDGSVMLVLGRWLHNPRRSA
jgi:hypothetical protein